VERLVVQPNHDGGERGGIFRIGEPIERGRADLGMSIVERGDESGRMLAHLQESGRAQRHRAPPPPPTLKVTVDQGRHAQAIQNCARPVDERPVPAIVHWKEQELREQPTMAAR
jgi:hypothetical protein